MTSTAAFLLPPMRLLLLLAGLLLWRPATAQDSLAVRLATELPVAPATTDTAAAIHRLFAAHRGAKFALLGGTCAVYGLALVAGPDRYGSYDGTGIRIITYTPVLLSVLLGEFLYFTTYNQRHERRAVADWQAHRLSPSLARRLKPRYFTESPKP